MPAAKKTASKKKTTTRARAPKPEELGAEPVDDDELEERANHGAGVEIEGEYELLEEQPDDPKAKLEAFFAQEHSDGLEIEVYKLGRSNRKRYLFACPPDRYTPAELFDKVLKAFGNGDYEIAARESGMFKFRTVVALGADDDDDPVAAAARRHAREAELVENSGASRIESLLARQTEALTALAESLRDSRGGGGLVERAQELLALKDLFMPRTAAQSLGEQLKDFKAIRELFGGADDADPLTAAVNQLAPVIAEAVKGMNQANESRSARAYARAQQAAAAAQPQPQPAPPANGAQPGAPAVELVAEGIVRMYVPQMLNMAAAGVAPAEAAAQVVSILQSLAPPIAEQVVEYLDEADDESLARIVPAVAAHGQWVNDTLDAVFDILAPEEPATPSADDQPDGAANDDGAKPAANT